MKHAKKTSAIITKVCLKLNSVGKSIVINFSQVLHLIKPTQTKILPQAFIIVWGRIKFYNSKKEGVAFGIKYPGLTEDMLS